ncbi:hypothetical protein PIB30_012618 [Stylosanthes scabra]|uniref:Uncharacterized protein n=1 Tax=Stylosanthes scabra TaxID=79078 RepID=A0ABU6Y496_9FABA|nr:hypothetical protein [Stylosanthes scabra]
MDIETSVNPHPPPRPLHQRRRSLRRRSFFTNLRYAPSVAAPSVVAPSVAPETTVNPHPLSRPHLSLTPSICTQKEEKKESSVAAPSVNPNLRRVLFTAIGAPSAAAPRSLLFTAIAAPSVALLLSARHRPALFL